MNEEINLITVTKTEKKEKNKAIYYSLLFLLVCVILSISFIFYNLYLKTVISNIAGKQALAIQTLSTQTEKRAKFLTVSERLSSIKKIDFNNKDFLTRINLFENAIPSSLIITTFLATDKSFTVSLSSENLSVLNTFLEENLIDLSKNKTAGVTKIKVNSMQVDRGGLYTTGITINFK